MKKLLAICLILICMFLISSCDETGVKDDGSNDAGNIGNPDGSEGYKNTSFTEKYGDGTYA